MGVVTTNIGRVSALVLCAGMGVALTGAAGGTLLAPMAGSVIGAAAPNFLHQIVDGVVSWFGGRKRGPTSIPANHDLDGLTACAIRLVFELGRDNLSTDDPKRNVLERLAKTPIRTIVAAMQAEQTRLVGEAEIVGTLGTPLGGQTTTVATPEFWRGFVQAVLQRTGADEVPSALNTAVRDWTHVFTLAAKAVKESTRDLLAKDVTARGKDPATPDAATFVAGLLHAHVAAFANDVLRDTFGPQGRFFIAALFHYLNTIATAVNKPPAGITFTAEHQKEITEWVRAATAEAIAEARGTPEPITGDQLAAAREVEAQARALHDTLTTLGADMAAVKGSLATMLDSQRDAHRKLDVLLQSYAPKLALPPVRRAAASTASAQQGTADQPDPDRFKARREYLAVVGREAELRELAEWLAKADPFLWDLWTGPAGSGKTRLALQLCREHSSWSGGFYQWTSDNTPDWTLWTPHSDTLVIFDYVAEKAKEIGDAIASLNARLDAAGAHPLPPGVKVRVLLLERAAVRDTNAVPEAEPARDGANPRGESLASPQQKLEAPWLGVLRGAATRITADAKNTYARGDLRDPGRYLCGVRVKDAVRIIYAEAEGEGPPPSRSQVAQRLRAVRRIDRYRRPLFVAMTAEAVREKGGAFDALDGGTGIDALVEHIRKKEWTRARERLQAHEEGPGADMAHWGRLLCLATMCGGLTNPDPKANAATQTTARKFLAEAQAMADKLDLPTKSQYGNGSRYALLVSGAGKNDAPKLEPDVLGEGFVLWWLETQEADARPLIDAAWKLGMADFVRRAAENFPARTEASGLLEPVAGADPAALAAAHTALGVRERAGGRLAALRARGKRLLTATHADNATPLHPPRVRALGAFLWMHGTAAPEELEHLSAALESLPAAKDLDGATSGFLALGLNNAIAHAGADHARADALLKRLEAVAAAHPDDAAVREQLAKGLFNAFNNAPANSARADDLLTRLEALAADHPLDAAVRGFLASGLFNAFHRAPANSARADALLKRLEAVAAAHPDDAAVREPLSMGLSNAIFDAGADHARADDLLRRLTALSAAHPQDAAVREPLAKGLFKAFNDAPVNSTRADALLARLVALADGYPANPAVQSVALRASGAAFQRSMSHPPLAIHALDHAAILLARVLTDDQARSIAVAILGLAAQSAKAASGPERAELERALAALKAAYQARFPATP